MLILSNTMKRLIILFFLIFINCKNVTKTQTLKENEIDKSVYEMWNNYIKVNPQFKDDKIPESDFFHNNKEDANRLAKLTITGKKKASSGLLSLYKEYNIDIPKVGTKQIITDFDGKAQVIIQNTKIDTILFYKISKEYAEMDMGTDIKPLEKWKKAHWIFFERFLKESGKKPTEEMEVVCIRFKKIWPQKH